LSFYHDGKEISIPQIFPSLEKLVDAGYAEDRKEESERTSFRKTLNGIKARDNTNTEGSVIPNFSSGGLKPA
jgi:DNA-binding PadR family transcriptional regulator